MKKIFILLTIISFKSYSTCDNTLKPTGGDIQSALNALGPNKTLCLEKGIYTPSSTIIMQTGQELRGLATDYEVLTLNQLQIKSNADRVISAANNTRIRHVMITNNNAQILPTFGILAHYVDNVTIWSVKLQNIRIGVGLNHSDDSRILNSFFQLTGDGVNGVGNADPAIWVSNSDDVEIKYGQVVGRNNPPHGDGEIGVYDSNNVLVDGVHMNYSGTSALYMVNCDYCTAKNNVISYAQGWGLDIVGGSDHFLAQNNTIRWSLWGGSVFYEYNSIGGEYRDNVFIDNNQSNFGSYCEGINVRSTPQNVTLVNNTSTGQLFCTH